MGLLGMAAASIAQPARFPSRPLTLVVPFAAGGGLDVLARALAERMTASLGQPVIVDNKAGANGSIAAQAVLRSQDGHTFLVGDVGTISINPALYPKLPYRPATDFKAVTVAANLPLVIITSATGRYRSLPEFIAHARANAGKASFGSVGTGSIAHLAAELFAHEARLNLIHVPYKGAPAVLADVISGQVDITVTSFAAAAELLKAGRLRALAVTSQQRSTQYPDVPTVQQSGVPNVDVGSWVSIHAPAGASAETIGILNRHAVAVLQSPEGRELVARLGFEALGSTPDAATQIAERDFQRWSTVIRLANVQPI